MAHGVAFIVPVVIDETRESDAAVPEEFMRYHWTRLVTGTPSPQFVEQVKKLLEVPRKPAAGAARATGTTIHSAPKKSGTPLVLVGAVAVFAIGAALYFVLKPAPVAPSSQPAAVASAKAAPLANDKPAVADKSIAVLPFTNMSEDKDTGFFADGVHEDLLTNLAVVAELKVISRTSVLQYRGTTKPMRQIGQELGVAYLLEGSVRRSGNKVRITGQLIRAATDEHVWAKSYDRDLTDIFAIQSAIAQEIASALSAALSPQEKSLIEKRPTANLAAYDLYLKSREFFKDSRTELTRAQAEEALAEAVKLDPGFAGAWGYLAVAHAMAVFGDEDHTAERLAKAKAAIGTAMRLAPDDPVVVEMSGNYYYYGYRDYGRAAEQYQRLLLIRPNSIEAFEQLGFIRRRQARWAEALANLRHAVELDPRNATTISILGETLSQLRQYDEAAAVKQRAAEIAPDNPVIVAEVTSVPFLARGSAKEFQQMLADMKETPANANIRRFLYRLMPRVSGDWTEAVKRDREYPYLDPFDSLRWARDFDIIVGLLGTKDLAAVHAQTAKLIPQYLTLLEAQPANATLWANLALLHAFVGHDVEALRCAHKAVELLPESADAVLGPPKSAALAQVYAWTGDKDRALAEVARLLHTPFGLNVHIARIGPIWLPLRGDPRFEALLADPKNNAPLF
jgi:TolB-like protein